MIAPPSDPSVAGDGSDPDQSTTTPGAAASTPPGSDPLYDFLLAADLAAWEAKRVLDAVERELGRGV